MLRLPYQNRIGPHVADDNYLNVAGLLPRRSFNRILVSDVHFDFGKKKFAASVAMIQSCRKRIGQVMTTSLPSITLHTPRGSLALSLVQLGTRLLNGQRRFRRWRSAVALMLSIGNPKTSPSGCLGMRPLS